MLFEQSNYASAPKSDQLEVALIGPGYGESVLFHIGDGQWFAIDSCVAKGDPKSASLRYLEDIGADLGKVFAIAASHWDDDHVRGLAGLVSACPSASFIMAKAFVAAEFTAYIEHHTTPLTTKVRGGAQEMRNVLDVLEAAGRTDIIAAYPNRCIYGPADLTTSHGQPIEIFTLSPSDAEYENFLNWVASQLPSVQQTRRVAVSRIKNDLSVVVLVSVGDDAMLFGGDLEEEGSPDTGWTAILKRTGRPPNRSNVLKVAHHGSHNGDHPGIWSELMQGSRVAILAPFRRGRVSLPKDTDIERILVNADDAYSTSQLTGSPLPKRHPAVERTIKEAAIEHGALAQRPGMLRLRKTAGDPGNWAIETFGRAVHLSKVYG